MSLSSWGRYPALKDFRQRSATTETCFEVLQQESSLIPRGLARSYGDSALAPTVLTTAQLDKFISFDKVNGLLHCQSGVSLGNILELILPHGWFLPILPGTQFVTVGGAIASDIHGKNHHVDGCFSESIEEFTLVLADGEQKICSRSENPELFHGVCGGMGLLGLVIDAKVKLAPVQSAYLSQNSFACSNLEGSIEAFNESDDAHYSVAWLDCLAKGDKLGRSILYTAHHADASELPQQKLALSKTKTKPSSLFSVPFTTPAFLLNPYSLGSFNSFYYRLGSKSTSIEEPVKKLIHYQSYFFPLDRIQHWNRLYGRKGFLQYQFVVPTDSAFHAIETVLKKITQHGKGSFLSVLKKFGAENDNLLSFPQPGFTLALDFKYQKSLFPLLNQLDAIVLDHGGRLYLAKDAQMAEDSFRKFYPDWQVFTELKQRVDPQKKFTSEQAKRIGLV